MDTLTHALSGALAARATAPGTGAALTVRQRVVLGFAAAVFPDTDVMFRLLDTLTYLNLHRGVTHSLVMLPLWAALLGWLVGRWRGWPWRECAMVSALGIGIHIAGDVINAYGTKVLAPLSDRRLSWPVTFIIDPWFTGIIAAALAGAWFWRARGRRVARAGLLVLAGYVGAQGILHHQAVSLARAEAARQGWQARALHALPQPLSPFNWKLVVDEGERYRLANVNLVRRRPKPVPPGAGFLVRLDAGYRPPRALRWETRARYGDGDTAPRVRALWSASALAPFRRFAMFPALDGIHRTGGGECVWFVDLRFVIDGRRPPFRFGLCRDPGGPWRLTGPA